MRTVALTGGIGAGKSMVSAQLAERGIPVYDADSRTKALYQGPLLDEIEAAFGRSFRKGDTVDFAALGAAAFASAESLALLESIVHPAVLADFRAWRDAVATGSEAPPPFVVLESAIITQKPLFDGLCDTIVVVYAPEPLRLERVRLRNPGLPEADIRRRIAAQRVDFSRADYLLINDATPDALAPQVAALYTTLSEA